MALIRSLAFALFFYPGTVVAVTLALLSVRIGQDAVVAVGYRWARWHRWCARHLLGIRIRVEGTVPTGAVLIASKHESVFETIDMLVVLGRPAIVAKQELIDIPGWGKAAALHGVIPIDREGSAGALRVMVRAAKAAIAAGRPILIFPEGTSVPTGERPPLRAGLAGLYRFLNLPLVPVAIDSGHIYPRRRFVKRSGTITIRFGEALPPGLPREELEARVHAAINALNG